MALVGFLIFPCTTISHVLEIVTLINLKLPAAKKTYYPSKYRELRAILPELLIIIDY